MSQDVRAVDPRQLELLSPKEEFLRVVEGRLATLLDAGELEAIEDLKAARALGQAWLPSRPGGGAA